MDKLKYKKQLDRFISSCHTYALAKKEAKALEDAFSDFKTLDVAEGMFRVDLTDQYGDGNLELYQYWKEEIKYVEESMKCIERLYGRDSHDIVEKLYIDQRTQEDVGMEYNMSRRQIQYSLNKWLPNVFAEMEQREPK